MLYKVFQRLLALLILIVISTLFISCGIVGTQIYYAYTNGVVDNFDEYYIELSDTTFSDNATWIKYEFLFRLKSPMDKKISIDVRSFVLREGTEKLGFNAPYLNCNLDTSEGDFYDIAIDNESVDEIYRSFSFETNYIITVTIDLENLASAYDTYDSSFSDISNIDSALALDVYGREIIFGEVGLI